MGYVPTGGSGGASIGGSVSGATAGSVFFAGAAGVLAQNNTAFKWVDADTQLQLTAGGATKTPLLLTLAGSQSADAFQVKNSGGTTIASIDKDGRVVGQVGALDLRTDGTLSYDSTNFVRAGNGSCVISSGAGRIISFVVDDIYDANGGGASVDLGRQGSFKGLYLKERTAPSAPSTNNVVLYAEDNGSGKTRLMALFPTGAAQQVAIEP